MTQLSSSFLLNLCGLYKTYSSSSCLVNALQNINLEIEQGEFVAITGSSGSGKSTLLNIIGLLDHFQVGTYFLGGQDVGQLVDHELANLRNRMLGFVFQSFNLITNRSALENVCLPLYYMGLSFSERIKIAEHQLERVGLSDRMHHLPDALSGGQQQRVAIARALATEPNIILADEPTGALDSVTSEQVMNLLIEINSYGKTLIIVTHELETADMAHRQIHLSDGEIIYDKSKYDVG